MTLIETVPIDDANNRAITMENRGREPTLVSTYESPSAMHASEAIAMNMQRTVVSADVPAMTAAGMTHTTMP